MQLHMTKPFATLKSFNNKIFINKLRLVLGKKNLYQLKRSKIKNRTMNNT